MSGTNSRGFTLLEVVAALILLGIGLSILFAGHGQASRLETKAREKAMAISLARGKLAQVEAGADGERQGDFLSAPGFRWQAEREPLGETGLCRLSIIVAWGEGEAHSVQVWALVSDGS